MLPIVIQTVAWLLTVSVPSSPSAPQAPAAPTLEELRAKAQARMRQNREAFTPQEFKDIEDQGSTVTQILSGRVVSPAAALRSD